MNEDEYIIINRTTLEKRIEDLESKIVPNPNFDSEIDSHNLLFIAKQNELNKILSQSTPLIPILEDAFDSGKEYGFYEAHNANTGDMPDNQTYVSNLKLDI